MMKRRKFLARCAQACAGMAFAAHLEFHSLVPVLPKFEPALTFARLETLMKTFYVAHRVLPGYLYLSTNEWDQLVGEDLAPWYLHSQKILGWALRNDGRNVPHRYRDHYRMAQVKAEASLHDFCIMDLGGNPELVRNEPEILYLPDLPLEEKYVSEICSYGDAAGAGWVRVHRSERGSFDKSIEARLEERFRFEARFA